MLKLLKTMPTQNSLSGKFGLKLVKEMRDILKNEGFDEDEGQDKNNNKWYSYAYKQTKLLVLESHDVSTRANFGLLTTDHQEHYIETLGFINPINKYLGWKANGRCKTRKEYDPRGKLKTEIIKILDKVKFYYEIENSLKEKISNNDLPINSIKKELRLKTQKLEEHEQRYINNSNKIITLKKKLSQVETDLTQTKDKLSQVETDLTHNKDKLSQVETDLTQTKDKLSKRELKLTQTKDRLSQVETELIKVKEELDNSKNQNSIWSW